MSFQREPHEMTRVDIATGVPFDQFVAALEKAAPPVDRAAFAKIAESGGDWDDVLAAAAKNAPNELMVYAKIDATELFSVAGHRTRAIEYLIGNHVIAETMFRHDAKALLYAPLRMLVYTDGDGNAIFTMDQPGPAFGSLGIDEVSEVGQGLDRKVVNLLRVAGVDVGQAFG
jgi:uncharacterized protein (DUF302 family)